MVNKDVIVHVGIQKTGTSFLQKNVFPYMDVNYQSRYDIGWGYPVKVTLDDEKPTLISNESFYGNLFLPRKIEKGTTILRRIKRLFPNAKIIVCFRNKDKWLKSVYNQFRKDMNRISLAEDFGDWYKNYFDKEALKFIEYHELAEDLFDNVLVLQYEDLLENPDGFVKAICDFIGVDMVDYNKGRVNRSWKKQHYKFLYFSRKLPFRKFNRRIICYLFDHLMK